MWGLSCKLCTSTLCCARVTMLMHATGGVPPPVHTIAEAPRTQKWNHGPFTCLMELHQGWKSVAWEIFFSMVTGHGAAFALT